MAFRIIDLDRCGPLRSEVGRMFALWTGNKLHKSRETIPGPRESVRRFARAVREKYIADNLQLFGSENLTAEERAALAYLESVEGPDRY